MTEDRLAEIEAKAERARLRVEARKRSNAEILEAMRAERGDNALLPMPAFPGWLDYYAADVPELTAEVRILRDALELVARRTLPDYGPCWCDRAGGTHSPQCLAAWAALGET